MEAKKQRPNVLITTYTSSRRAKSARLSAKLDTSNPNHESVQRENLQEARLEQQVELAKKIQVSSSEKSTDLFVDIKRRLQPNHQRGLLSNASEKILIQLSQIRGPSGSVRGHRDVVRRSLENIKVVEFMGERRRTRNFGFASMPTFTRPEQAQALASHKVPKDLMESSEPASSKFESTNCQLQAILESELERKEYLESLSENELNLCVAYTTSLGVIRRTFEDSRLMKSILDLNLIRYEERDIYLNREYREELRVRCMAIEVPVLFVDGRQLGGVKKLESLNENGELSLLMAKFKMPKPSSEVCKCCGNAKFIACQSCNGSRKSSIHHFKFNSIALRCTKCDKNQGIVACPVCCNSGASCRGGVTTGSSL